MTQMYGLLSLNRIDFIIFLKKVIVFGMLTVLLALLH